MPYDDSELIRRYQNGEVKAFEILVRKYQRQLFTFLWRLVGNRQSAEDLFQDTFLRMLDALPMYKDDGRFVGWLFGIANNLAIDHLRRRRVRSDHLGDYEREFINAIDDEISIEAELERLEAERFVESALQCLPEKQRQVFLLRQHSGMSFKEIAETLHEPLNTVLSHMHYAVTKLRKQLRSVNVE